MCMTVLTRIRDRAERSDRARARGERAVGRRFAQQNGQIKRGNSIQRKGTIRKASK